MALTLKLDDIKPLLSSVGLGEAPPPARDMSQIAPPPMPKGPTPAVAGFGEWAADPQNQQKIAEGITPKGTSLLPPTAPPPDPRFANMASAAPPARDTSFMAPPAPAMGSGAITLPPPPTPNVQPQNLQAWEQQNPDQVAKPQLLGQGWKAALKFGIPAALISAGSGLSNMGHGDPTAGMGLIEQQAARDRSAPELNQSRYNAAVIQPLKDEAALADTQSQTALRTAQGNKANAQADAVGDPAVRKQKQIQDAAKLGMTANFDESGNLTGYSQDDSSPIQQSRKTKDDLLSAQVESAKSQKELRDAQAALAKAKNDPNSPAFKQAQQRLVIAQQNAGAAATRAQAYMGNYLKGAFNTDLKGNALPGAPIITNDQGDQTVVGATNAGSATKAQSNAAQFNDVHGALDSIEQSADALIKSGGRLNSPGVAAALARPKGEITKWLQGEGVKANLTPQERAYVQSIAAGHENIQALRKSAGGTATDSSVEKLDALIPDSSTPDLNYLKGQTNQIRQTAQRLGVGATTATGGLKVRGQGKGITPPPSGNAPAIKVGQPVKLKNGQTITVKVVHPDGSFE
jgi:hypothetical protein